MKYAILATAIGALLAGSAVAQQAAGGTVTAVESSPGQATMVQTKEAVATVQAIDIASRKVTLRDAKGRDYPLVAGEDVRNLEQVKVGDRVVVRYAEALSLKLMKNGKELRSADSVMDGARAPVGAKPGGVVAEQIRVKADVIAVDEKTRTVTLKGPKQVVDLYVRDPAQFALIKVGDQIDAEYTQALALSVQPAPSGK